MKRDYPQANISYLGGNVINSLYQGRLDVDEILRTKKSSNKILIIGGWSYIDGAKMLVEAFRQTDIAGLELHIVGLTADMFGALPDSVHCHGYLRKDVESECNVYYSLLLSVRMVVNPTPKWGGVLVNC